MAKRWTPEELDPAFATPSLWQVIKGLLSPRGAEVVVDVMRKREAARVMPQAKPGPNTTTQHQIEKHNEQSR